MSVTDTVLRARRLRLLEQIERHGPEHFDMGFWIRDADSGDLLYDAELIRESLTDGLRRGDCGTAGCLFGHGLTLMLVDEVQPLDWHDVARYYGFPYELALKDQWVDDSELNEEPWDMERRWRLADKNAANDEDVEWLVICDLLRDLTHTPSTV
jgi:hypothetical protein